MRLKENEKYINIEMQVSTYPLKETKRFQYYGSQIITSQEIQGEMYKTLVSVHQIIFIDDMSKINGNLNNCYQSMDQEHVVEKRDLVTRYFIYQSLM